MSERYVYDFLEVVFIPTSAPHMVNSFVLENRLKIIGTSSVGIDHGNAALKDDS